MSITAEVVRQLREETGAGMMDCKAALVEATGDMAKAREVLRKKGLAAAAKKASRTASDGAIGSHIAPDGRSGVVVEVNCETDFVAKTPDFQALVKSVAEHVHENAPRDVAALLEQPFAGGQSRRPGRAGEDRGDQGEHRDPPLLPLRAGRGSQGRRRGLHPPAGGQDRRAGRARGRVGRRRDAAALAKDVAMHVAAASPAYVSKDEVPADVLAKEKEIYREQALASGKPANVVDKIAEGKLKEYYATFCLLEQPYVREQKQSVGQHLKGQASVRRFARLQLGEEAAQKPASEQ